MATISTNDSLVSLPLSTDSISQPQTAVGTRRLRMVSPETGRAIEMLGHAIEYLADEFALDCMDRILGTEPGVHPRLIAIEMLKARNRDIYLSCPEAPTWNERLKGWLRRLEA